MKIKTAATKTSGNMRTLLFGTVIVACLNGVFGNGRLLVPPQRSSLWRDPLFYRNRYVVKNYDDHTLNCGGFWKMHENDGRCGVCGDPWDAEEPRPNEAGGLYARGIIGRTYSTDKRFIDTVIQVTSSMSGYFEFNICPNDNVKEKVSEECLSQFPLRILSKDRSTSYGSRYFPDIKAGLAGIVEVSLEIPDGLECKQCVLRWRWHGANNYGICRNGRWGKGCGEQPEIYNCADIAILPEHVINGGRTSDDRPIRPKSTSTTTTTQTTAKATTNPTTPEITTQFEEPLAITTTTKRVETSSPVDTETTKHLTTDEQMTSTTEMTIVTTEEQIGSTTQEIKTIATKGAMSTKGATTTTTGSPIEEQTMQTQEKTTTSILENTTTNQEQKTNTTIPEKTTTMSQTQTSVVSNERSTSVISEITSITTLQSEVPNVTTVYVQTKPEDSVSIVSTLQPEPELRLSTEQLRHSTSGAVDQTTISSEVPAETERLTTTEKAITESISSTYIPLSETDATKTEKNILSTGEPVTETSSKFTQEQTTIIKKHTTDLTEEITTRNAVQKSTEVQAIDIQNETTTTSSFTVSMNNASPGSAATATGSDTSVTSTVADDKTQSSGVDQTMSQLDNLSQNATTQIIDSAKISELNISTSTHVPVDHTTASNGAVRNEMITVIKSDTLVTPIEITMRPLIENTTKPKTIIDATDANKLTQTGSNKDLTSTEGLQKMQETTTELINMASSNNPLGELSSIEASVTSSSGTPSNESRQPVTRSITSSPSTPSNESRQPFISANIVTSTSMPEDTKRNMSLVDLLNAISNLENVTSDELLDVISTPINSSKSDSLGSNGSAIVNEDTTSLSQTNNDINESTVVTNSPQNSRQQTTEKNLGTGSTTDLLVNPDMLFDIVTSRTTRISQPQGGRFGGGISIAKISPVDNVVNIDLNIPGGEAHVEKERNRMNGGS